MKVVLLLFVYVHLLAAPGIVLHKAGATVQSTEYPRLSCSADLAAIDPMYQYSLPWFTKLVLISLSQAAKAESVPERLEAIHSHFTSSVYRNVCRSV